LLVVRLAVLAKNRFSARADDFRVAELLDSVQTFFNSDDDVGGDDFDFVCGLVGYKLQITTNVTN
jgi:hypothetical protein